MQGACGYGKIAKDSYPYWSVAALSLSNSFSVAGPAKACGECFEIKCVDIGGPFAVRLPSKSHFTALTHYYLAVPPLGCSESLSIFPSQKMPSKCKDCVGTWNFFLR